MKSRDAKKSQRREEKKEDQKRESLRRKKIQVRENVGKSRNTAFFPMICGSGGSKSRLAKSSRCGARWGDERWKITRRCHISKSKCTKHTRSGPLLEVEKVEKVHAVVARSTFRSQIVKNTRGSDHFWTFRCRFAWQAHGIVRLVKSVPSSIRTTCNLPLQVVKHLNQRRRWLYKIWAPSKILIFDGAQNKQCWPASERTLSGPRFWWGNAHKSSIRTICNLPLQVVKHLNQRRWWLYKVWAPFKTLVLMGLKSTQCWPESERTLSSQRFWWGISHKSSIFHPNNM